jgi:DNA-binding MarR family transcriptional regulator
MAGKLKDEIRKAKPFASAEQEAFLNALRTADVLTRGLADLLKPAGLSPTQYNVLRILRGAGGGAAGEGRPALSCGEIAERMITAEPDVTRLLDRLEKAGLAERERSTEDRRVVRARVTEKGLAVLERLDGPVLELHERQLGHLGRERLRQLIELLEAARDRKR